jgi:putative ATP-dependent endonuclease of the OLD family
MTFPKKGAEDQASWIELSFNLSDNEWENIADKYKDGVSDQSIVLRRYFKGDKAKAKQSNIYGVVNGIEEDGLFYEPAYS